MFVRLKSFLNPPITGFSAPWRVFWVGFLVRLAYMTLAHTYRLKSYAYNDHFDYGFEAARIARALVEGDGYADAFANVAARHNGPTAWLPPLYPVLIAGVFKVFGVYTKLSAWVILAINCVFSGFTARSVWEIGSRFAGRRCGLWAGWIWALYPAAMQYAVRWIWEMTVTTALFTWVVVLTLRMRQETKNQTRKWLIFGVLWGLIALSNSTLLLFLPVCGIWVLMGTRQMRNAVLAGVVFVAVIAPWSVRNYLVFHAFIPMRGNFGAELYLGNGPGSTGFLMDYDHPFRAPEQLKLYGEMGEVRYVAMRGAAAKAYIAADPLHFVKDTALRVYFFWASVPHPSDGKVGEEIVEAVRTLDFALISLCGLMGLGLALRRRVPGAGLFAWAFVLLPIPYYLVTAHARFRHPLEPLICVLGVYLFQSAERKNRCLERGISLE